MNATDYAIASLRAENARLSAGKRLPTPKAIAAQAKKLLALYWEANASDHDSYNGALPPEAAGALCRGIEETLKRMDYVKACYVFETASGSTDWPTDEEIADWEPSA